MRSLLLLLSLCACGSTVIDVHSLSHACSVDADCVAVYAGDACQACHCSNTAIAASAQSLYEAEATAASSACRYTAVCSADCALAAVQCAQGVCALK
jgi:hypothetical protein